MTPASNTPSDPHVFPPKGDVWFHVGEQTYTMSNEEAWALAWQLIGELVRQKDKKVAA